MSSNTVHRFRFLGTFSILLTNASLSLIQFSIGVVIPLIASEFKFSVVETGLALSTLAIATPAISLATGYLLDRISRRLVFLLGILSMALGTLITSQATSPLILFTSFFVTGIGSGIATPAIYTIMGARQTHSRGLLLGMVNSTFHIGGITGAIVSASLATSFGWRIPFLYWFLVLIIALVCGLTLNTPMTAGEMQKSNISQPKFNKILTSRNILILSITMISSAIAVRVFQLWTPTFLFQHEGLPLTTGGLSIAIASVGSIPGSILLGRLSDLKGERKVIAIVGIIASATSLTFYLSPQELNLLLLPTIFGFTALPYWNLQITFAQKSSPRYAIGRVTGIIQTMGMAGGALGPILTGAIAGQAGILTALISTVCLPFFLYGTLAIACRDNKTTKSNTD